MNNKLISPGVFTLALTFLGGIWLSLAPFVLQIQPAGMPWLPSTVNDVAAGGLLITISLLGILAYLALSLNDVIQAARRHSTGAGEAV